MSHEKTPATTGENAPPDSDDALDRADGQREPAAARVPELDQSVTYACRSTARAIERYIARRAHDEGMDLPKFEILRVLWQRDGLSQREICDVTRISASATAQVIYRMEDAELVERRADPSDRRLNRIFLLPRGEAMREHILGLVAEAYQRGTAGLSAEDAATFVRICAQLRRNHEELYKEEYGHA